MRSGRRVGRVLSWVAFVVAPLFVASMGVWLLYRASRVTNPEDQSCADRLFVFGVLLLLSGMLSMFVRSIHSRSHDNRVLADRTDTLSQQMRGIERQLTSVRQDVDSRLAVTAWMQAFDRTDGLARRQWVEALDARAQRTTRLARPGRRKT